MYKYLLLMALFAGACSSPESNQGQTLTPQELEEKKGLVKSVMAIHDEAMPWMDEIHSLRKDLQNDFDSTASDSLQEVVANHIQQLNDADEAMMSWMRQYKEPGNDIPMDSIRVYLKSQKKSAAAMRAQMSEAIDNAKSLLE